MSTTDSPVKSNVEEYSHDETSVVQSSYQDQSTIGAIDASDEGVLVAPKIDVFEAALEQLPRTLLHYDEPKIVPAQTEDEYEEALSKFTPAAVRRQATQLSERPVVTTTDKVLVSIFPPRVTSVVNDDGETVRLVQPVYQKQATRQALGELRDVFDYKLQDSKARSSGICPVRRTIHAMLLDELVRQVVIDNPELGLLLLRIRDELQMTLDAYTSLYDASQDYGSMKLQEGTVGKPEMLSRIKDLTAENEDLRKEVKRLQTKHLSILRCVDEQQQADNKKFAEEKAFWERTRQRLVQHLETVKQMQEAERKAQRAGITAPAPVQQSTEESTEE